MNFFAFIFLLVAFSNFGFSNEKSEKVVILGSGPAGLTSAIFTGQANLNPLIIEGNECDGQLVVVQLIENFPGYPEGIRGGELIEKMRIQATKFGARFHAGTVIDIDLSKRPFKLILSDGNIVYTETLIIALGTSKRWLGLASEEALKGKGVHGSATCEGEQYVGKKVVVVGGTDSALEEALTLAQYAEKVTIIWRNSSFNAVPYLKDRIFSHKKIQVIFNNEIVEILDLNKGHVTAVVMQNTQSQKKEIYPCDAIFVAIGRKPNTDLFKGQLAVADNGFLMVGSKVGEEGSQTNVLGVFAAGDIADSIYRKVTTATGSGCMAGIDAIKFLARKS